MNLPPTRDFGAACKPSNGTVKLIAEVKKKSPSKGIIREDFEPVSIAETYVENGAAAISVLTDKHFFAGELAYLRAIREVVDVPLLRKDFTIDPYHIYQARVAGGRCYLTDCGGIDSGTTTDIHGCCRVVVTGVFGGGTHTRRISHRVRY
ncbi:Indole-3-glycerol phosphate synthase [Geodia barretti]|uniref:indole-3-glycerol-phosphate synthase n=1 Tax=Geodia barretti TaxID=519541 RepID=A0AA35T143_GEOBA|nr:Indole-3-glycerol phosphate synthase [Geodia barretti]